MPVISLLLAGVGLFYYYSYEKNINEEVLALLTKAEAAALEGNYEQAEKQLQKAAASRPEFEPVKEDMAAVQAAIGFEKELAKAAAHIQKKEYDEASNVLSDLKKSLDKDKGMLTEEFYVKIADSESKVTIGKIKSELQDLETVDELSVKLSAIYTLSSEEANAVKQDIVTRIIDISIKEAAEKLKAKHFTEAESIINRAMQYAGSQEKLVTFSQRIQSEQQQFEQAEQKRLEEAMVAAAREEMKNRNEAVKVENIKAELDEYGDLTITGEVKNTGTRPVESVEVAYSVNDNEGNFIGEDAAVVYPHSIEPGEKGFFEKRYYGVSKDINAIKEAEAVIDDLSWVVK
ncbi:FxLYD domain-containing protein [Bacillus marinisedimentorum]|uniref:FxLYD domain-containing protein n=1 Tax=Bacillus marinisedimentorum TaxID=1821260 RepID=UPI000872F0EC|nr:FxLYD domain-containing protein [Bacillus marinisedimentorum]